MMIAQAVRWIGQTDGYLDLIDQRLLPGEEVRIECRQVGQVYDAIKTLAVRGAPAIGVAAGYGLVLAIQQAGADALELLSKAREYLAASRPTAVNLFWALDRIEQRAKQFVADSPVAETELLQQAVLAEANAICNEDIEMCRKIGENGQRFIEQDDTILTHCNAGALATAGQGTALSVMYEAKKKGKGFKVYADETRPLLQGGRLTAWELERAGIEVVVICDNMAGWLMKQGRIDLVITGADRIAANGDMANKIGTYALSVLAKKHSIPFYVAAPSSTFDLSISSGAEIPIEQRDEQELKTFGDRQIVPDDVKVYNPAFDVTEAGDITAIITEKGVIERPNAGNIVQCIGS